MELIIIAVAAVVAIVAVAAISERIAVAAPLSMVVVGIALSFLPGLPKIQVDPEWILARSWVPPGLCTAGQPALRRRRARTGSGRPRWPGPASPRPPHPTR